MWAYLAIFRLALSFFLTLEEYYEKNYITVNVETSDTTADRKLGVSEANRQESSENWQFVQKEIFFFHSLQYRKTLKREEQEGDGIEKKHTHWSRHARAATHKTQASRVSGDPLFSTGFSSSAVHRQTGRMCTGIKLLLSDNIGDKSTKPQCETVWERFQKKRKGFSLRLKRNHKKRPLC